MISPFDFQPRTRVVFGQHSFQQLGTLAKELGFRRTLLVADPGMVTAGYVERARQLLCTEGIDVFSFHDFNENPNSLMVEAGKVFAAPLGVDSIVGLGGGSSLDCAKGINFVLTNGGRIQDYWGYGKASAPMLPMIGIPTTAGTGSEAQCYALITDDETKVKMACGDPKAAFQVAIIDPVLTLSQPPAVTAMSGYDALSHAVESYVTTKRNPLSDLFAREAFRLLEGNYERVITHPNDLNARATMQLGAYYAGVAIENSMLGATHACANPLTARYGVAHGKAIALLLPVVVRWNSSVAGDQYHELLSVCGGVVDGNRAGEVLARRLAEFAGRGGLQGSLRTVGVSRQDLPRLADEAAQQWTGRFNPRPFDAQAALEVYEWAY
jgi:alcohol dehydrogenase